MTDTLAKIAQAQALLAPVAPERPSAAKALGAAALAATAALLMAGMVVVGPGVQIEAPVVIAQP